MAMSVEQAATELAQLAYWPAEQNTLDGKCLLDGAYVGRGAGRIVLGADGHGTFAGYLHADCAERVSEVQERSR
jgi:hypothetical protein